MGGIKLGAWLLLGVSCVLSSEAYYPFGVFPSYVEGLGSLA